MLAFASHNQLCMYGFSDVVNLLGNTPGTAPHLQCGALGYESVEIWVTIKKLRLTEFS